MWSAFDNPSVESGNNRRSAAGMSEVLQINERTIGSPSSPVRANDLILDHEFTGKAAAFLDDSKSEIRLCAYAWRWYANEPDLGIQKFNIALMRAKQRGVVVRCLVNNYAMFVFFSKLGFKCRYVERHRSLHTKAILVDKSTLILGSHNLTKRANSDNFECSIAVQDTEIVLQFAEYFDRMWAVAHES